MTEFKDAFMQNVSVSLLLNWYSETTYLAAALNEALPLVDEVVVVGGPYEFAANALEAMNLAVEESEALTRLRAVVPAEKLVYVHGDWSDEGEKRTAGYAACSGDWVLVLDADEVMLWDFTALASFFASPSSVGGANVINIATDQCIQSTSRWDYVNLFPRKNILFRRSAVTPAEHINYLWLVGVAQDQSSLRAPFPESLGLMHHMTGPRGLSDHLTRVIFYQCLWKFINDPDSVPGFIDEIRTFADYPAAFLARSPAGIGLREGALYRAIPDSLKESRLWSSLRSTAHRFGLERLEAIRDSPLVPGWDYYLPLWSLDETGHRWSFSPRDHLEAVRLLGVDEHGECRALNPVHEEVEPGGSEWGFSFDTALQLHTPFIQVRAQ